MSEIVKVKSGSKYETLNSYSRVVVAGDMIFVSNTAGRNYKTRAIAPDARGQAEQAFSNIEGALAAVSDRMCDAIDVLGDGDTVRDAVRAYVDAGVEVPVLMPLSWGGQRRQVITETMEAAASA